MIALGETGVLAPPVARRARPRKGAGVEDVALGGLHVAIRVSLVVPGRGADTEAMVLLVGQLELAHQVEAVGHHISTVELGVGFVIGSVVGQRALPLLGPYPQVVAQRIVPTQAQVRIPGPELLRLEHTATGQGRRQANYQTAADQVGTRHQKSPSRSLLLFSAGAGAPSQRDRKTSKRKDGGGDNESGYRRNAKGYRRNTAGGSPRYLINRYLRLIFIA
ncbi:hypothetical protein D9M71_556720 [compost metagenome]